MPSNTQWTKSGIGLYRYNPSGQYHARVRVGGRLYRRNVRLVAIKHNIIL